MTGVPRNPGPPTVLWWSRSGRDYSRDRIVRRAFQYLGWQIEDFCPLFSQTAHWQARLQKVPTADLLWVPCFRQRDAAAAQKWASRHQIPVVLDPLISAWDKQVFERGKFPEHSAGARRLLNWESHLLRNSTAVVADTRGHAELFASVHRVQPNRLHVIPVSAEESLFHPTTFPKGGCRRRILFYGSYIGLQGPEHIVAAARQMPQCDWLMIGEGPLTPGCRRLASRCTHIRFRSNVPYTELKTAIADSHAVMGIFGTSHKAARVIPNKVYQAMACGRPVVTRSSDAYPTSLLDAAAEHTGINWAEAGSPESIVASVTRLLSHTDDKLADQGRAASHQYRQHFSEQAVRNSLQALLASVCPDRQVAEGEACLATTTAADAPRIEAA
ncbi:MAG: glycosyltransferase [Planctomycetaceae bacterium]|nr:glycosyltransferase [Planctomycetaceae bacterium]